MRSLSRSGCVAVCSSVFAATFAGLVGPRPALGQLQASVPAARTAAAAPRVAPIALPLSFVPNEGQDPDGVRFTADGTGYTLQLKERSAILQLDPAKPGKASPIELELLNSNPGAEMTGAAPLPGVNNYVPASDPQKWRQGVPRFGRVEYDQVYPGTGLSFYAHQNSLEYDFRLQPGASADSLRMAIRGAEDAHLDAAGNLVLTSAGREIRFLKPVAYQPGADNARDTVAAHYTLLRMDGMPGKSSPGQSAWLLSFDVGAHDAARELVIDPVLSYGSILPSVDANIGGITADAAGNLYVAGYNQQRGFYIAKFTTAGANVFTTVVGSGLASSVPTGIVVDSTGKIYVTGYSNTGLPTTSNAYLNYTGTHTLPFLAVFPATGAAPTYLSYFGGSKSTDYPAGIAVDASGDVYLAGSALSSDFPTTTGAYQTTNPDPGSYSAFVAKFNPAASGAASLVYSTLIGSTSAQTVASAVAVDSSGDAYISAASNLGYPISSGAYAYKGAYAASYTNGAFVTKVNPTGTALLYSAFLGPGIPTSLAINTTNDVYVTGSVQADDFPTTGGAYQTTYPGGFVSELNATGSGLIYSTFLSGPSGGSSPETGNTVFPQQIVITPGCASSCAAYISGYTTAIDFPAIAPLQSAIGGNPSPFLVELAGTGASATFSTYLGGLTSSVQASFQTPIPPTPSVAVDSTGNIYFAANMSGAYDYPTTLAPPATLGISYIAKITPAAGTLVVSSPASVNFDAYSVVEVVGIPSTTNPGPTTPANPVQIVLRNMGTTAATISSIAFSPATEFSETDQCALSVPAGGTCTLNLIFTPSASGKQTATLTVTSNAANSPLSVALSGTATAIGFLQASVPELTFADLALGSVSAPQTITITNIGKTAVAMNPTPPTPASINSAYGSGADFQVLDNCPASLAAAASCNVSVTFSPLATGFREASVQVTGSGNGNPSITVYGTGIVGGDGTLTFSATTLNFNTELIKTTSAQQSVTVTNASSLPITIYSTAIATKSQTTGSDFALTSGNCISTSPVVLRPQGTCSMAVRFTPTVATSETGTITVTDSSTGGTHIINLTGIGLASAQALEFSPGSYVFPNQPLTVPSTAQTIYVFNTSTAPVQMDRVLISGDFQIVSSTCPGATLKAGPAPGVTYNFSPVCSARITFTPTVTGARTGTLSFVDSAGGTQVLNLSGTGITATGGVLVEPGSLVFPVQAIGTTSTVNQHINIYNPGNAFTTINSIAATGNYAIVDTCQTPPFNLNALANCGVDISFTPVGTTNPHAGTLVVNSAGGAATTTISGTGVTATTALGLTPTAAAFGNIQVGVTSFYYFIYVRNTGTDALTLTSAAVTAGDFALSVGSCGFYGNAMAPGTSCYMQVSFLPTAASARTGTVTLVDSAGTQTIALTGTGTTAAPATQLNPAGIAFNQQTVGTTSAQQTIPFQNHGTAAILMSTVSVTAGGTSFVIVPGSDHCTGISVAAAGQCTVAVEFSPTAAGYETGSLTFTDSAAVKYVLPMAGYAAALAVSSYADPTSLNFPSQVLTTTSATQSFSIFNTGNTPLTVGTLIGTNTIVGTTSTGVFSANSAQGGNDSCTGVSIAPASRCTVSVTFTPATAVASTGSITVPITYSNATTGQFVLNFAGTGVAVVDSAQLTPTALNFADQAVNAVYGAGADATQIITLDNTGNLPITLGPLTGTAVVVGATTTGDFSTSNTVGGNDGCSAQTVAPRSNCQITVAFKPTTTGARTGSVVFPVTYSDKTTTSLTATFTGKGIASTSTIVVSPSTGQFDGQIVGTTSTNNLTITVSNTGNQPVKIATSTLTSSFSFAGDSCSGTTLGVNATCSITVAFSPTTTGAISGTLTIPDNATGNPHKVSLAGNGLPTTSQIVLSQTAINFGKQLVATKGGVINVFVTNLSTSTVTISAVTLGGTNPTDYVETNGCAGIALSGLQYCTISLTFNPAAASTGVRTATVVETDTASGSPRYITLTGTGVAAAPSVAFYPASLNFGTVNLGTQSAAQTFSVTNTGTANLVMSTVVSSNPTEFPITSNTCAGKTIAAGANCLVNVAFKPNAGSTQTASITLTDNVTGSPQTVSVTGVSLGIPQAAITPSAGLTFTSEGVGVAAPTQALTLTNAGTDVLKIASVAVGGTNASSFTQTNTCGTSIATGANCVITVTFKPTAVGSLTGTVVVTDNAGNVTGTTQSASLAGTGTGVAKIAFSPTSLTFASTDVSVADATQTITLSNPGTAPLTITALAVTGADPSDFTQTHTCTGTVAAAGSCTITVTFNPIAAGTRTASVSVTDNAAASPQTVALTGTAVGVAEATVSGPITFASQIVATTSAAQTATVTNSGSASLVVASFALSGTNAADFKATSTTCPGTLAIAANCGISITFTPGAAGARTATLTITDNAGNVTGTKQTITLTGTGTGVPQATITPASFAFASEAVGSAEGPLTVSLKNGGTGALTVASIKITGTNATDFLEFDTCVPTVNINVTCEIALYFVPKAVGARTASVVVTDNAGNVTNATQTIAVTGTATGAAQISFSKTALTFTTQKAGSISAGQSITVTNTGNATLTVSSAALGGSNPGDFMEFNGCSSVAAGDSCELVVFFMPTATGARSATVVFTDNANGVTNATQTITLSGTGD